MCETNKTTKTSSNPKRQQNDHSDPLNPLTAKKKLRKGYVYEVVSADVSQPCVLDANALRSYGCAPSTCCERSTQTMCSSHLFSILMEQLVSDQANFSAGLTSDLPITLPSYVSRRLMLTQQLMVQQSEELNKMYAENKRLDEIIKSMVSVVQRFRDVYATDLRRLRDFVQVLKGEFSFYQDEFVAEANKSVDNIQALKERFQRKLEDYERKNRLLSARVDFHIKEKEAAEERADGYLRDISARDRDIILANKSREKAERKLRNSLYVANNAKCRHCVISERMQSRLISKLAEKTILLEKSQKECSELKRRADQADRISQMLLKDSEKLRFELNTWKSDAERSRTEIARLKEELRKSAAGLSTNSIRTQTRSRVDSMTTNEHCVTSNSPGTPIGKDTQSDYEKTSVCHRMRSSGSPNCYDDTHRDRSSFPRRNVSTELRQRRTSGSCCFERGEPDHLVTNTYSRPFNEPTSLSSEDCSSRPSGQHSPQTRKFTFSSSPLPWHRKEPWEQSSSGKTNSDFPSSPTYYCDNSDVYNKDHFHSTSTTHRSRRNFWDP